MSTEFKDELLRELKRVSLHETMPAWAKAHCMMDPVEELEKLDAADADCASIGWQRIGTQPQRVMLAVATHAGFRTFAVWMGDLGWSIDDPETEARHLKYWMPIPPLPEEDK